MRTALEKGTLRAVYDRVAGRYDVQHTVLTAGSDQRGRRLLVEKAIRPGDRVLDCGAGTGSTTLLALEKVGSKGRVTLFDLSEGMLAVAKERLTAAGVSDRVELETGDMHHLPVLKNALNDEEPMIREHAQWAIDKITSRRAE